MKPRRKNTKGAKRQNSTHTSQAGPRISEQALVEKVQQVAEPALAAEGLELVAVEFAAEPGSRVLRLYVDAEGGVTIDDCVMASRQVSDLLDVFLGESLSYRLEVSSPGVRRPLTKEEHFNRFSGHRAAITTTQTIAGRKKFTGVLAGVKDGTVTIKCDGEPFEIAFSAIASARLAPVYGENPC